jgi:hypothetical protein
MDEARMGPVYRRSVSGRVDYIYEIFDLFRFYTSALALIVNDLIVGANTLLARKTGELAKITDA